MSTDALLTLAAALVAVLTLMSPEARDDLRLRATGFVRLIAGLALAILIAIKLSPIWIAFGMPALAYWRGFDAETASFITIALAVAFILARVYTARLQPRQIDDFARLSERLLFAGKFAELLFLLERHFSGLRRLLEGQHLSTRVRERLKPASGLDVFIGNQRVDGKETLEEWENRKETLRYRSRVWLADRLPSHDEHRSRARRLLDRVFLSEDFVSYVSKARPDFALRVLDVKASLFTAPFLDTLIREWMRSPTSILYEETLQIQSLDTGHRFKYSPLNPVIWHFFGEPFRAEPLAIFKPVGDFVIDELTRLRRVPEDDIHRKPQADFSSEGKWRSPIQLGLRLFDFWISESLHRGTHWHGWLMYWEDCVEGITLNMDDLQRIDNTREFPTPYHYLLYEVFDTVGGWIEASVEIDQSLESVKIDRIDMTHDTIAKSAVITFGRCLRSVIESPNLTDEFKAYIAGMVFYRYGKVVERDDTRRLYEMSVLKGGDKFGQIDDYYTGMRRTLWSVDKNRLYMEPGMHLYELLSKTVGS